MRIIELNDDLRKASKILIRENGENFLTVINTLISLYNKAPKKYINYGSNYAAEIQYDNLLRDTGLGAFTMEDEIRRIESLGFITILYKDLEDEYSYVIHFDRMKKYIDSLLVSFNELHENSNAISEKDRYIYDDNDIDRLRKSRDNFDEALEMIGIEYTKRERTN